MEKNVISVGMGIIEPTFGVLLKSPQITIGALSQSFETPAALSRSTLTWLQQKLLTLNRIMS